MTAQLTPVALLEQLAPTAALAEQLDPGVELGRLGGVALGQWAGRLLDQVEQLGGHVDHDGARCHRGGPGSVANAVRRDASSGSTARIRARVRSPRADVAAARATSTSVPSATSRSTRSVIGDRPEVDADAARGDRHQLGRHEVGEGDEVRRRRRLLDRLQEQRRALGPQEVQLVEDQHLAVALDRCQRGESHDLARLLDRDGRSGPHDLPDVGVLAGERQPRVAVAWLVTGEQLSGERPRRLVLRRARRSDQQVRVDRATRRSAQLVDRLVLADDRVPQPAHTTPFTATCASTCRATSSGSAAASTTTHRSGSAAAIAR